MSARIAEHETSPRTIRVVIADDHALVRGGFVALLAREPDIRVVGQAGDGPSAVDLCVAERPDVLCVDLSLPGLPGLEVARRVQERAPEVAVVIVSVHKDDGYVLAAIRAGASGYVVKEGAAEELVVAIRDAIEGKLYLSPIVARAAEAQQNPDALRASLASPEDLTPRERDVLVLVADGLSTKEIANRLGISVKTADAHRQALMRRIGIHDVAGLTKFALKHGLTALP